MGGNDNENELDEENRIDIFYEKELTSVVLSFKDLYSNTLLDDATIEWQIGAEYKSEAYERIKDKNGARWSKVSSDPKAMIVREKHNHFTLIYDEIRTKVIIRYININDDTAIKEPDIVTAKLGVLYIPNIQKEFIDSNRLNWTYVGEKELSITTRDNEQDNIIVLKYEPHNANVTVRYLDENGNSIIKNNVKPMQIGMEVQIKQLEKIYSSDKLGYKLKNISNTTLKVSEDENFNVVDCIYTPLLAKVVTLYKSKDGIDLIKPLIKEVQVGTKFSVEIIDKVIDSDEKYWNYIGDSKIDADVVEDGVTIDLQYEPEIKKVITKNFDQYFVLKVKSPLSSM